MTNSLPETPDFTIRDTAIEEMERLHDTLREAIKAEEPEISKQLLQLLTELHRDLFTDRQDLDMSNEYSKQIIPKNSGGFV